MARKLSRIIKGSTIRHMLFYYRHISIFLFFLEFVVLVTATHAKVYCIAYGGEDVIQYTTIYCFSNIKIH